MNPRNLVALLAALSSTATLAAGSSLVSHSPMVVTQYGTNGSVVSSNWSGFAVAGAKNSITALTGSWTVPAANCGEGSPKGSRAAHWIGMDGYSSATIEQIGTNSDCVSGKPTYYAWYQLYPSPNTGIHTLAVEAGDVMNASVAYDGSQFVLTLTNERTQKTFTTSATVANAKRNSAEWIAEDDVPNFTNFNAVGFGQDITGVTATCTVTLTGSIPIAISTVLHSQIHPIIMADSAGTTMAIPGPLSADGSSFVISWWAGH